jgi:hypothetical protein
MTNTQIRLLCLHGWKQSKQRLYEKSGAFRKGLSKFNVELCYIDAPFVFDSSSITPSSSSSNASSSSSVENEMRTWMTFNSDYTQYFGWQEAIEHVLTFIKREGPFDGILGFSQGAVVALLVIAMNYPQLLGEENNSIQQLQKELAEKQLIPHHLKYGIFIGGLPPNALELKQVFDTIVLPFPSLHIMGETDSIIPMNTSIRLMNLFEDTENRKQIVHKSGHVIPHQKDVIMACKEFLDRMHPQ